MISPGRNLIAPFLILSLIACTGVGDTHKTAEAADSVKTLAASMKVARSGHTATLLPNGQVLIAGGMNGNGTYFNNAEIYSQATDAFTPTQSMSAKRVGHTATLLPGGKVLIAGGYNSDYLASAELYDPATAKFTPTGQMTMPRSEHIALLLNNGKVLLAGGVGVGYSFLAGAELYDPSTGTFTATGSMTAPRESHTATLLKSGKVLITGGHKDRREAMTVYSSAEVYDPVNGAFKATGDMTTVRHKHAAVLLPDGNVLIVGGSDKRDWQGKYNSAEIYISAQGTFKATGNMNEARFKLSNAVALLKNGRVLIAGGGQHIETYVPETNTFSIADGQMDTARFFSAATLLQDGRVLITGGYDDDGASSARAWIYKS